jgi:N-acetylmuramoyl-L-alanine amidase
MKINFIRSPNFTPKKNRKIQSIIIHYTGMKTASASIKRLKNKKSKVSCHYLIDNSGKIIQMVKDQDIAWHAGISYWDGKKNLNNSSIGIELQNKGEEFGYEKFRKRQITSLINLITLIKQKYNVYDAFILGHSDIAPDRKIDPGYFFPWNQLYKAGIGLMPNLKSIDNKEISNSGIKNLQLLLREFGYKLRISEVLDKETLQVLYAFQSHYCPAELKQFKIKNKLVAYLKALIKAKNRSLTKKN